MRTKNQSPSFPDLIHRDLCTSGAEFKCLFLPSFSSFIFEFSFSVLVSNPPELECFSLSACNGEGRGTGLIIFLLSFYFSLDFLICVRVSLPHVCFGFFLIISNSIRLSHPSRLVLREAD